MANSKDQTIADYYQNCPCCGRGDGLQLEADSVPWRISIFCVHCGESSGFVDIQDPIVRLLIARWRCELHLTVEHLAAMEGGRD